MVEYVRHDSFCIASLSSLHLADHSMSLAAASLAIGEHSAIVAPEAVLNKLEGGRGVHFLLVGMLIEDFVKAESLILASSQIISLIATIWIIWCLSFNVVRW